MVNFYALLYVQLPKTMLLISLVLKYYKDEHAQAIPMVLNKANWCKQIVNTSTNVIPTFLSKPANNSDTCNYISLVISLLCSQSIQSKPHIFSFPFQSHNFFLKGIKYTTVCVDFTIALIPAKHKCYCGDLMSRAVRRPDVDCNITCPGEPSQMCGGRRRISVYDITPFGGLYLLHLALSQCRCVYSV